MAEYRSASGSSAEDLFIELFADTFGAEKAGYLYSQYPFYDIYQNARFADFVLENGAKRLADWIAKNKEYTKVGHVLCFAWNEFEEGAYICPTLNEDESINTDRITVMQKIVDILNQ